MGMEYFAGIKFFERYEVCQFNFHLLVIQCKKKHLVQNYTCHDSLIEVHACGYAHENDDSDLIVLNKLFWQRTVARSAIRWIALLAITGLGSESHFLSSLHFLKF